MASKIIERISQSLSLVTVHPNIDVTPEIASELLSINRDNRPLKSHVFEKYAREMKEGKWRFTGDTFKISKSGKLLDGQHRAEAIVRSGTVQRFNIQTGLDDDSFDVMDIGKNRSAGDVLAVKGYTSTSNMATAIRIVDQYLKMKIQKAKEMRTSKHSAMSNHDILQWLDRHDAGESMQRYVTFGAKIYERARFLTPATVAAFTYIFSLKDREAALLFFELLSSGDNIGPNNHSMIYLLRQKLINMALAKTQLKNRSDQWALIIKAWNFYRTGNEIKRLEYNPDKEDFPVAK